MGTIFFLLFLLGASFGCKTPEPVIEAQCDKIAIVSNSELRDAPRDPFTLKSIKVEDDCLEITLEYGGGCGEVDFQLIASEDLDDSLPQQRAVILSLKDEDPCRAINTETISFDLTPLRVDNASEIILAFEFVNAPIYYRY